MDSETNHHQFRQPPKRERRVRFADSMGMELASIFLFDLISNYYFASIHNHKQLSLPPPPPSNILSKPPPPIHNTITARSNNNYNSLTSAARSNNNISSISNNNNNKNNNNNSLTSATYTCQFTQPISLISFKERVKLTKVQLETCSVNSRAGNISVSCTIRVLNQSYDKSVILRYTTDEWHTYTDTLASYSPGSHDGWSDKFTSTFSVTNQIKHFKTGQRVMFACRYICGGGEEYWDNNAGLNYSIEKTSD